MQKKGTGIKMKAAVFYGRHNLRIEEVEPPKPDKKEVLIEVKACGICGTDVHIFEGDEGAAPTPSGTVLGHEFSGTVTQIGDGVTSVKVGDTVCVDPNRLCNECFYCKSGIGHFCESMIGIGTTVNGGFAQMCVVPESQVYVVPNGTTFEQAAMTEPVACCLHGMDMCDISAGDAVLVIGGGMIGLVMMQLAKIRGAAKIIVSEPVREKRELALRLGADLCVNPLTDDIEAVLKENGINRLSTVIECVGSPSAMQQAISLAGVKSTVMLFGLTKPNEEISLRPFEIFKKEITLKASFINPYTMKRALDLISSKKIDVSSMIYKVASLEELSSILSDGKLRSQGKWIIRP